ncbi:TPA: glutathione ABC transporter permease GsiD [bacterium]|nr:glutathione ABC transporter permease GsiD [bacterium]
MKVSLRGQGIWLYLKKGKVHLVGLVLIFLILLLALSAPFLVPFEPSSENLREACLPPDTKHLLGTDELGRDVFSRVLYGARISLVVGCGSALFSILIGFGLGLISGYIGGKIDSLIMRLVDVTLAFPSLLLAIGISCVLPRGLLAVIIALSVVGWASFARITRGIILSIKEEPFVEAAVSLGSSNTRILFIHLLPHTIPMVMVLGAMRISTFILAESGLSFLGLGVPPPTPSWGGMVSQGADFIRTAPWISLFPGMAIALTVVAFNLLGDGLADFVSPKFRKL